jgi:predicted nucleic acid-binding protein
VKPGRVLDSSVLIAAHRGSESARRAVAQAVRDGHVVLPSIACLEFRAAPRVSKRWRAWFAGLEAACGVTSLDAGAARVGARVARQMARQGRKLGAADAAVVGCGAVRGATVVVTADADFDALPPPFSVERV